MIYINKIITILITAFMVLAFIITVTPNTATSSQEIEETADMRLPMDDVIYGKMEGYSERFINVDGIRYRYCSKALIFSPKNMLISKENIDQAKDVNLYMNRGCVRKIHVLRFAE